MLWSLDLGSRVWRALLLLAALASAVPSSTSVALQSTAHNSGISNQTGNVTEYVTPSSSLTAENLPPNLTTADIPPTSITLSLTFKGVTAEQFENSFMQRMLQNITGTTTGTAGNQWTIQSFNPPLTDATAAGLYNVSIPVNAATNGSSAIAADASSNHTTNSSTTAAVIPAPAAASSAPGPTVRSAITETATVLVAWGQCGGLGGVCGFTPGFDCTDGSFSGVSCPDGHVCKRQSQWYWQCDEDPEVLQSAPADPNLIGPWQQCGGKGGECNNFTCADAAYPGRKCVSGYSCTRKVEWYWQCMPNHLLTGRKLLQQASPQQPQQPAQRNAEAAQQLTVTMTITASDPQLVVYRLSRPIAATRTNSAGCLTEYCYALAEAGLPIDSSSIQVEPDLNTLFAQAAAADAAQTAAEPPTGAQQLSQAEPGTLEQQGSASNNHTGTIVGATLGGVLGLLLLVMGGRKVKDRYQASAVPALPNGPSTAESPASLGSQGKDAEDQGHQTPQKLADVVAPVLQMKIGSKRFSFGTNKQQALLKGQPTAAVAAPVAYAAASSTTAATKSAVGAADASKNASLKPELAKSFSFGEMLAGAARKPTRSPEYPGTPPPQSPLKDRSAAVRTGTRTPTPTETPTKLDSGELHDHFNPEHSTRDSMRARQPSPGRRNYGDASSHTFSWDVSAKGLGSYLRWMVTPSTAKPSAASAEHADDLEANNAPASIADNGLGSSSATAAPPNRAAVSLRRSLSDTELSGVSYSSSPAAARAAGAAAAAALQANATPASYPISNPTVSEHSCSSSVASARAVPAADVTVEASPDVISRVLPSLGSTTASPRSSVASAVMTAAPLAGPAPPDYNSAPADVTAHQLPSLGSSTTSLRSSVASAVTAASGARLAGSSAACGSAAGGSAAALDVTSHTLQALRSSTVSPRSSVASAATAVQHAEPPLADGSAAPQDMASHMLQGFRSSTASPRSSIASAVTATSVVASPAPDGNVLLNPSTTRLTSYALASLQGSSVRTTPTASIASGSLARNSIGSQSLVNAGAAYASSPTASLGLPPSYPRPGSAKSGSTIRSPTTSTRSASRALNPTTGGRSLTPWAGQTSASAASETAAGAAGPGTSSTTTAVGQSPAVVSGVRSPASHSTGGTAYHTPVTASGIATPASTGTAYHSPSMTPGVASPAGLAGAPAAQPVTIPCPAISHGGTLVPSLLAHALEDLGSEYYYSGSSYAGSSYAGSVGRMSASSEQLSGRHYGSHGMATYPRFDTPADAVIAAAAAAVIADAASSHNREVPIYDVAAAAATSAASAYHTPHGSAPGHAHALVFDQPQQLSPSVLAHALEGLDSEYHMSGSSAVTSLSRLSVGSSAYGGHHHMPADAVSTSRHVGGGSGSARGCISNAQSPASDAQAVAPATAMVENSHVDGPVAYALSVASQYSSSTGSAAAAATAGRGRRALSHDAVSHPEFNSRALSVGSVYSSSPGSTAAGPSAAILHRAHAATAGGTAGPSHLTSHAVSVGSVYSSSPGSAAAELTTAPGLQLGTQGLSTDATSAPEYVTSHALSVASSYRSSSETTRSAAVASPAVAAAAFRLDGPGTATTVDPQHVTSHALSIASSYRSSSETSRSAATAAPATATAASRVDTQAPGNGTTGSLPHLTSHALSIASSYRSSSESSKSAAAVVPTVAAAPHAAAGSSVAATNSRVTVGVSHAVTSGATTAAVTVAIPVPSAQPHAASPAFAAHALTGLDSMDSSLATVSINSASTHSHTAFDGASMRDELRMVDPTRLDSTLSRYYSSVEGVQVERPSRTSSIGSVRRDSIGSGVMEMPRLTEEP